MRTDGPNNSDAPSGCLDRYRRAERLAALGHWLWRPGRGVALSPGLRELLGISGGRQDWSEREVLRRVPIATLAEFLDALRGALAGGGTFAFDGVANGEEVRISGEVGGAGMAAREVLGVVRRLSDRERLAGSTEERHLNQIDLAELSSDWTWEMGPDLRFTRFSPQIEEALGKRPDEIVGRTRRELLGDHEISLEMEMHLAWLEQHEPYRDFRYWVMREDGERRCIATSGKPLFDASGTFQGYIGSARDVTDEEDAKEALLRANRQLNAANKEKSDALGSLQAANALLEEQAEQMMRAQADIRHTALHDPLTGIANRRYLDDRLVELSARCKRSGDWLAALHVDLDRFKQVNDTAGHAAGDALLIHVAEILKETVRADDFVARVGGDEFLILCAGSGKMSVLSDIAERIIDRANAPFPFEGRDLWFGASIGIATMTGDGLKPEGLLVNADIALYRAKNGGRARYEYFSEAVQAEIIKNHKIADGIRVGMTRGEFLPHYQPQFDANTFEIAGFEALARWEHPDEGTLSPGVFLKIAEDLNAVAAIDRTIMERAVADYRSWTARGIDVPRLSVNVSAKRLLDPDLIKGLLEMDIPSGVLAFELLESVFLDDPDELIAWNIDMLKEMGIAVELDDFGSGHASIIGLIRLGPDAIKIDRELISTVTVDVSRRNLVGSIIDIGKSLDVRIVAEGVETRDHADLLRDLGCDLLQGFYFSSPLRGQDVPAFAARWASRRVGDVAGG